MLSNCCGTVVLSANQFQTADMKKSRLSISWARSIIRRWCFDKVNFDLITKIYIHTVDHTVDNVAIGCSLLLESPLPGSCCTVHNVPSRPLNVTSNDSLKIQLVTATLIKRAKQQLSPRSSQGSRVHTTKTSFTTKRKMHLKEPHMWFSFDSGEAGVDVWTWTNLTKW